MDMNLHEISSGGSDLRPEEHRKLDRDQLRPLRRKLHYQPTCLSCQCCQSKTARKYYAALILVLLIVEILVSLHFVTLENNSILGDARYNDIPTDNNNNAHRTIIYPIHPKKNVTPYTELCEDCRLNPSAAGRPFTCYDRMLYLRDIHHLPEADAREDVIKTKAEHCAMTRFPSPYDEEEYKAFDSVFSMWSSDNNGTGVVGGGDAVLNNADTTSKIANRGVGHNNNISIYIYETIPKDMGIDLERNMAIQYASPQFKEENFKADLAIIDLFRTYSGRIYDPAKADLLVVPFPHASHCLSSDGWWNECGHVSNDILQRGVLDNLPYYVGNEKRHLFINAQEIFHAHKLLRNVPLSLTLGPRVTPGDGSGGGYQIVVPYLNDQRSFQPSAIRSRPKEWWTRPRKYSLAYFFGSQNKNMYGTSARIYRTYFLEEVQKNWNATSGEFGGLPYVIQNTGEVKMKNATAGGGQFFSQMYGESVFCPTLPGDSPSQKRFFDVIAMGCIPVVLAFDTSRSTTSVAGGFASNTSWHSPGGYPMGDVYPYAKGSNGTYPEEEIDYRSFVVEVYGGVGNVKPAIEALMENPGEIRRRQLMLRKYAPSFCYGMGRESHSYGDAFSKMMESVRFYLSSISSET